jgi:phage recombination protein Bet
MTDKENKDLATFNKIAETTENYTAEQIAVIKKTVAKNTTDTELAMFIYASNEAGLRPLQKEIWCYKDNKNNLLMFAGRDGFLKKAQENPAYSGIRSCEIREKDEWEIDIPNGKIHHLITAVGNDRGKIIGAYSFVFRKGGEPTIEFAEFDAYNKGYNVWKSHPAEMIKKVAETHALKKAFGISGIQSEYDFEIKGTNGNETAVPITQNTIDDVYQEALDWIDEYQADDKELKRERLKDLHEAGQLTKDELEKLKMI